MSKEVSRQYSGGHHSNPIIPSWIKEPEPNNLQDFIKQYVENYELRGDDEGDHVPNQFERMLIMDAIQGLIIEDEFEGHFKSMCDFANKINP